jgi:hypothetical protein
MNTVIEYADKLNFANITAWFITAFLVMMGYKFFKSSIDFVLVKFYELFIGSKNHLAP